jgi:mannose-1-phosphate guanylyltransferase
MSNVKTDSMQKTCACIMAGGVGSRFWPASRESMPKQFLDITGNGKSLLRTTFERLTKFLPVEHILVITSEKYRSLVLDHLPELNDNQIIGEPMRRNTAPAALLGTIAADRILGESSVVIMTPADQVVKDDDEFAAILKASVDHALVHENLHTIGVKPDYPHTGYGYIQYDQEKSEPFPVTKFTEKPNRIKAEAFLADGNYLWNAGIFTWSSQTLYKAFETYAPETWDAFQPLFDHFNQETIHSVYENIEGQSIDYQIMEKARNVVTWPGDFGWSDVGSWRVVHETAPQNEQHNLILSNRHVIEKCSNSLFSVPENKVVVAKGLDGFIVIDTGDVLVIYPKEDDQELKDVRKIVIDTYGPSFE